MRTFRILLTSLCGVAFGLSLLGSPTAAAVAVRYVDDDGRAGRGGCDGRVRVPSELQPAVDASRRGDTVLVCPGTYTGKVFIRRAKDGLRLAAATDTRPVLRPPRSGSGTVLVIRGARGVVVEGLRFRPHGGRGSCTEVREFIRVLADTRVRIVDNVFAGIEPYTASCNRYSRAVFAWEPRTGQRVDFARNVVRDFGGTAVAMGWDDEEQADPQETSLRIASNRFVSRHRLASKDGIAVWAWVAGRAVISDNVVTVDSDSRREVGLAEVFAEDTVVSHNVGTGLARGIHVAPQSDVAARVEDNILRGRAFRADDDTFDLLGILLHNDPHYVARNVVTGFAEEGIESQASEAVVEDNDFHGNGGIDCRGGENDGEFEIWRRNLGDESRPTGLCSPS